MRRGFTLLELSYVIAILAILAALTVPAFDTLLRRARTDEARTNVHAISWAELQYFRDHGTYLACAPTGAIPKVPEAFPTHDPCWKALRLGLAGDVRYRYGVSLDGDSFQVVAEGDLDRDGQTSRFVLHGRDDRLDIQDELE